MNLRRLMMVGTAAFGLTASVANADEYTARYDQFILNGDSVLNGAVLGGAWQTSFADALENELGVMQRPRTDYEPKGLPLGGFRLFPVLDLDAGYNDNVYATKHADGDGFFEVNPSVTLRSQWERDTLNFYAGLQTTLYDKFSTENTTDFDVGSTVRLEFGDSTDLRANIYYDGLHEPRTSPNEPGAAVEPTRYKLFHSDLMIDRKPNRFGITIGGVFDNYNYDNTRVFNTLAPPAPREITLSNADRDESIYTGFGRISYDFSPGYSAFIGASYESRDFAHVPDLYGYDRSSTGYHIDAGTQFFISRLVQGQVFIGYLDQNFKKQSGILHLADVNGLDYGANINWYVTPVLTLHLGAARTIDDTTIPGASAIDDQSVYLDADYELRRDIIIQGQVGFLTQRFVGLSRTDDAPTAGFEITWLINHNFRAFLQFNYNDRNSDVPGADYTQNVVMLGLRSQL